MSNLTDQVHGLERYYGVQKGIVTRTDDPTKAHRVKVVVPGIVEPETAWLYPLTMGGGSAQRGGHILPAVGAHVAVWFHDGDPNGDGFYNPGNWSASTDDGTDERPIDMQAEPDPAQAALIDTLQIGPVSVTFDMRDGKRKFVARDDTSGDFILWDLQSQIFQVHMSGAVVLEATGAVSIKGLNTIVHDKIVIPNKKAIG